MQDLAAKLADKDWRMDNLYKITTKEGKLVTFNRNRAQRAFNKAKKSRNIILKSRQLGFTTDETIDTLDDVISTPNFEALFLSYDIPSQTDIFDKKILLAWENLPEELRSQYIIESLRANQLKIGFGDGTYSSLTVRTKGRSGTFQRLHVSEFAKICAQEPLKAKEIVSGTMKAVPLSGRIDIESTAEGDFGYFYDMFWEAWERGEPTKSVEYKAHFFNWTFDDAELQKIIPDPDIPSEFKDYQKKYQLSLREITYYYYQWLSLNKDWDLLHQEYPTTPEEAFISSGDKFFSVDVIGKLIEEKGDKVGEWTYFEDYKPAHRYAIGVDVGEGIGKHGSAACVIDFSHQVNVEGTKITKPKVVAIYWSNKIGADTLAYEVKSGATRYGNCLIAVERNNHGHATLSILKMIYNNLYIEKRQERLNEREGIRLGWHTNKASKPKMLYDLKTVLNEYNLLVPSKQLQRELMTYPKQDLGKVAFKEDDVHHWDIVIALAIAWQMNAEAVSDITPEQGEESFDKFSLLSEV